MGYEGWSNRDPAWIIVVPPKCNKLYEYMKRKQNDGYWTSHHMNEWIMAYHLLKSETSAKMNALN